MKRGHLYHWNYEHSLYIGTLRRGCYISIWYDMGDGTFSKQPMTFDNRCIFYESEVSQPRKCTKAEIDKIESDLFLESV